MKRFLTLALASIGVLTLSTRIKSELKDRKLDRDMKTAFPGTPE